MKKCFTLWIILGLTAIISFGQTSIRPSGNGTSSDPFQIATLENLYWFSQNSWSWSSYFEQTADIDASSTSTWNNGAGWVPPGRGAEFTGNYNGKGHVIDGLYMNARTSYSGFIGKCNLATIENLGITNLDFSMGTYSGGLIGFADSSTINQCYTTGLIRVNENYAYRIGGIAGVLYSSNELKNCFSTCDIIGNTTCYEVGGIAGRAEEYNSFYNCYATGDVSGFYDFGGFLGRDTYRNDINSRFYHCYSIGKVSRSAGDYNLFGGFCAESNKVIAEGCFWNVETSECATSSLAIGKTTAEMHDINLYLDAGWNFIGESNMSAEDVWFMDPAFNNGYPALKYQYPIFLDSVSDFTSTTATAHYKLVNVRKAIVQQGVCWNYTGSPTLDNSHTSDMIATQTGSFTSNISDAVLHLPLYVRAYLINEDNETQYSNTLVFNAPQVGTVAVNRFTNSTARVEITIPYQGNPVLTEYGVCWNTTGTPTLNNNHSSEEMLANTDVFRSEISGLIHHTTYYARAYCVYPFGVIYGSEISFTALNPDLRLSSDTIFFEGLAGASLEQTIQITNSGDAILEIDSVHVSNPGFTIALSDSLLEPGSSASFVVSTISLDNNLDDIVFYSNAGAHRLVISSSLVFVHAEDAGNAMDFDGADDYISFSKDLSSLTDFTLEQWIYIDNMNNWARTFDFGNGTDSYIFFSPSYQTSGTPFFEIKENGTTTSIRANKVLTTGRWHHIAITLSRSKLCMYFDGVLDKQNNDFDTYPSRVGKTTQNWIGRSQWSADSYFDGKIDETRIWSKALTQEEIRSHYGSLRGDEDGLYAYWRFDEADGNWAYDATGNVNTGRLINGTLRQIPSTAPVGDPVISSTFPTHIDLDELNLPEYNTEIYTVTNTGKGILHLDFDGLEAPYSISEEAMAVLGGESANITIAFTPDTVGRFLDTLTFSGNVAIENIPISGAAKIYEAVDAGNSVAFDGTNDYINCGTGFGFAGKSFSADFWAKRNGGGTDDYIIAYGTGSADQGLQIGFRSNNKFTFSFWNDDYDTPDTYTDNQWHHWACTYDASSNNLKIYCDGVKKVDVTTNGDFNYSGDSPLTIGSSIFQTGKEYNGQLDEVRIWHKALTQEEIRSHYGFLKGDEDGLYAYWRFDEAGNNSVYDATGNGNTGTLMNGTVRISPSDAPVADPEISLTPASLPFGLVYYGDKDTIDLTVANNGGGFLHIDSLSFDKTNFAVSPESVNISSNSDTTLKFIFHPVGSGDLSGYVMVNHNMGNDSLPVTAYSITLPEIALSGVYNIGGDSAVASLIVTTVGAPESQHYGLCWNTTGSPALTDNYTNEGALTATGTYDLVVDNLSVLTTYYLRAYVVTDSITTYSNEVSFTTDRNTPVISWDTPSAITYGTALTSNLFNATASYNGETLEGTFTYDPLSGSILDAGSQQLYVTFYPTNSSEYKDVVDSVTLTIEKAVLNVVVNDASRIYGASDPDFTFTYQGFVNDDDVRVLDTLPTVSSNATRTSNVGTYTIEASDGYDNNYSFSYQSGTLTIEKAALMVSVNDTTRTYGSANPDFTFTYTGFADGDDESVLDVKPVASTTATPWSDTDIYFITVSGASDNNYNFTYKNGILLIEQATLMVTANDAARAYSEQNPGFTFTYSGFVNGEDKSVLEIEPTISCAATVASNAGSYAIEVLGGEDDNYSFSYQSGTLTVEKVTLTVKAHNASRTYGAPNPDFTFAYTGFMNSEDESVLDTEPTASTVATATSNAGNYTVDVSGGEDNNYDFSYQSGTLTIGKATLTVTANNTARTYGDPNPHFTLTYTGFVNGDNESMLDVEPVASTTATPTSDADLYYINVNGGSDNNYNFTYERGILLIERANLTVTAHNATRAYGEPNPVFTFDYNGFVNGEDISVLDVEPTINCAATVASNAGSYAIEVSGGYDDNYSFIYQNGILTITGGPAVPVDLSVAGTIIVEGLDVCFNAQNEITVAGSSDVIVEADASANFIAGTSIRFLPGFHAEAGSYVHGLITTDGSFCDAVAVAGPVAYQPEDKSMQVENLKELTEAWAEVTVKVYPNPGNGQFHVVLSGAGEGNSFLRVLNMQGVKVYSGSISNLSVNEISLKTISAGLYLMEISTGAKTISKKIIVR